MQDDKFLGAVLCHVPVLAAAIAIDAGGCWRVFFVPCNDMMGWPHTGEAHMVRPATTVAYHARGLVVVRVSGIFVGFGGQAFARKVPIFHLASPTRLVMVLVGLW